MPARMAGGCLTVLGETRALPEPFYVLATQNPIEIEGTYPLPEAQLDRFLFKLEVGSVDRATLEAKWNEMAAKFPGEEIPLPPNWGGYVLKPERIEFWQGRPSRLHDRFSYTRQQDGAWKIERLAP